MIIQGKATERETWKSVKVDYPTAWTLILSFFVIVFNFVLLGNNNSRIHNYHNSKKFVFVETLGTSLTMDQFAWNKGEALYYMGQYFSERRVS